MFEYVLEQYKEDVYSKNNRVSLRELKVVEKIMLFILCASVTMYIVFILLGLFVWVAITVVVLFTDIICMMKYSDLHWKRTNVDKMKQYKEDNISVLINLLRRDEFKLYDKNSIKWLIDMCDQTYNQEEKTKFFTPIKSFFTFVIYPIITATIAIVIKDVSANDVFKLSIVFVGLLCEIFAIFYMIYPSVDNYMNKKRKLIETLKSDLQYVLLKCS